MEETPSGTIAFLFTDIVGSTNLWLQHPTAMNTAVADHDRIVGAAIRQEDGYVFTRAGDSFSAAFEDPVAAARAAVAIRRELDEHPWGITGPLHLRMAIHLGVAHVRDGDYFGPALSTAARILETAQADEVLCSSAAADVLRQELPAELRIEPAGRRRLADLERREDVYRLRTLDESSDSPSIRAPRSLSVLVGVAFAALVGTIVVAALAGGDTTPTTDGNLEPPQASNGTAATLDVPTGTVSEESRDGQPKEIWHHQLDPACGERCSPPVVVAGRGWIAAIDDDEIIGLDPQGNSTWTYPLGPSDVTEFAFATNDLLIATTQAGIVAIEGETGGLIWEHPTTGSVWNMTHDERWVFATIVGEDLESIAVSLETGELRWSLTGMEIIGISQWEWPLLGSAPPIQAAALLAATSDSVFTVIDPRSGLDREVVNEDARVLLASAASITEVRGVGLAAVTSDSEQTVLTASGAAVWPGLSATVNDPSEMAVYHDPSPASDLVDDRTIIVLVDNGSSELLVIDAADGATIRYPIDIDGRVSRAPFVRRNRTNNAGTSGTRSFSSLRRSMRLAIEPVGPVSSHCSVSIWLRFSINGLSTSLTASVSRLPYLSTSSSSAPETWEAGQER